MANEWNISYPLDHTLISAVPGEIRALKESAKTQIDREHETPVDGDATGGEHSKGSAVAFHGTDTPTTNPGGVSLGDNDQDNGRLWLDDNYDPPVLKRWSVDGFESVNPLFGTRTTKDSGGVNDLALTSIYLAECDGILSVYDADSDNSVGVTTGPSNPPTEFSYGNRGGSGYNASLTVPVKAGEYVEVNCITAVTSIFWLPWGSGGLVKQ